MYFKNLMCFFLLLLTKIVDSFRCYHCHSENITECESSQNTLICYTGESTCLTMIYLSEKFNDDGVLIKKTNSRKKCLKSPSECFDQCKTLIRADPIKKCSAQCCTDDLCNKDIRPTVDFRLVTSSGTVLQTSMTCAVASLITWFLLF